MKVLLVDDHDIVRKGLAALLSSRPGFEVAEAADTPSALDAVARERPQLVVLDLNLPGRSGFECLEVLSRTEPTLPVLVLSAFPESGFAARALKLGAKGYVTKSTASGELLAAIDAVLGGRRYVSKALAEALAERVAHDDVEPVAKLSHRELEVLRLIAQGLALKEIAVELKLSEKTVGTYRARLGEKLGLRTNVDLTRFALEQGLLRQG